MKKILLLSLIIASGCATGTHVACGKIHPAINVKQVTIYNAAPAKFETMGTVGARAPITLFGHGSATAKAIRILKIQAAEMGANGVLLSPGQAAQLDEIDHSVQMSGTAIFVP